MKRAITTTLMLGLLSGAANAADLIIEPMMVSPAPVFSWEGLYAGAQVGWLAGSGAVSIPAYPSAFTVGTSGFVLGAHAGYNWELAPSFIIGVEGDLNWTNASGSALSGGAPGELYQINQSWYGSLRGRIGWAVDQVLIYGTAGLAGAGLSTQYVPLSGGVQSATVTGWTAGAGVELAFTDQISGRLEYRYTDYNTANFTHVGASTVDYVTHAVTAGASFHF